MVQMFLDCLGHCRKEGDDNQGGDTGDEKRIIKKQVMERVKGRK